jgi:hypothetical protein
MVMLALSRVVEAPLVSGKQHPAIVRFPFKRLVPWNELQGLSLKGPGQDAAWQLSSDSLRKCCLPLRATLAGCKFPNWKFGRTPRIKVKLHHR